MQHQVSFWLNKCQMLRLNDLMQNEQEDRELVSGLSKVLYPYFNQLFIGLNIIFNFSIQSSNDAPKLCNKHPWHIPSARVLTPANSLRELQKSPQHSQHSFGISFADKKKTSSRGRQSAQIHRQVREGEREGSAGIQIQWQLQLQHN